MSGSGAAVVPSAGKQLVTLGTRLVVGISMENTIMHIPPHNQRIAAFKLRPYLKYFATVLHKFKCDVTIFSYLSLEDHWVTLARLRRELEPLQPTFFPVPVTKVALLRDQMIEKALLKQAGQCMTPASRILFIDSECDIKFTPAQTIVLERFAPVKRLRNSERDQSVTPEQGKLALTMNDYSLVALGELIKDLAASNIPLDTYAKKQPHSPVIGVDGTEKRKPAPAGIAVEDFLRLEPLVEKVHVPMHGLSNYLPMENCDHMDCIDLEKLEISEPLTFDHVNETDEHKQMFQ